MVIPITIAVIVVVALAECLHWRRCRRVAHLHRASRAQMPWTYGLPFIRLVCITLVAWAICILLEPHGLMQTGSSKSESQRRLLILLDVSPSMHLIDAGPDHTLSRAERTRDLTLSLMERSDMSNLLTTVIAFYNGAKPVVIDAKDIEVIRNIVDDLPLDHAFEAGKTNIAEAVKVAAKQMHNWPDDSTDVIIFSDGDSVPEQGLASMPDSCRDVLVVGVGSPRNGRFIDGHQSRQDASTLRQLARRLRGIYHDGNEKHIPSMHLQNLATIVLPDEKQTWDIYRVARYVLIFATCMLAALPLLLHIAGSKAYHLEHKHA